MEKYEIIIRDKDSGDRWSMLFQADNFAHAEEQALDGYFGKEAEIVTITKDYVVRQ